MNAKNNHNFTEQFTHLIKTEYTNYDGTKKQIISFVNAYYGWFDHFYKGTNNKFCANGGAFGRLESIHTGLNHLFNCDKSIQKSKTIIYKIDNLQTPFLEFTESIKQ